MDNSQTVKSDNFLLRLDMVDWKPSYVLSKASLGQIMQCFNNIKNLIPKNLYERTLYSILKKIGEKLTEDYESTLISESKEEYSVKYHNLIVKLPLNVSINEEAHGNIKLKNASIGKLILASKQRIDFILKREPPLIYINNSSLLNQFEKMKKLLQEFYEKLIIFEEDFVLAIDEAKTAR